jgi:hypothetical protein
MKLIYLTDLDTNIDGVLLGSVPSTTDDDGRTVGGVYHPSSNLQHHDDDPW